METVELWEGIWADKGSWEAGAYFIQFFSRNPMQPYKNVSLVSTST